jgi:hypothetical protein
MRVFYIVKEFFMLNIRILFVSLLFALEGLNPFTALAGVGNPNEDNVADHTKKRSGDKAKKQQKDLPKVTPVTRKRAQRTGPEAQLVNGTKKAAVSNKVEEDLTTFWELAPAKPFANAKDTSSSIDPTWIYTAQGKILSPNLKRSQIKPAKELTTMVMRGLLEKGFSTQFCLSVYPYLEEQVLSFDSRDRLLSSVKEYQSVNHLNELPTIVDFGVKSASTVMGPKISEQERSSFENHWLRIIQSNEGKQHLILTASVFESLSQGLGAEEQFEILTHLASTAEHPFERSGFATYEAWLRSLQQKLRKRMTFSDKVNLLQELKG